MFNGAGGGPPPGSVPWQHQYQQSPPPQQGTQLGMNLVGPPPGMYGRPPLAPSHQAHFGPPGSAMGQQSPPLHAMGSGQPLYTGPPPGMIAPTMQPIPSTSSGIPAHTTVFVGTISPGVTDEWIHQLLTACGPLKSFKRVNASFGFAEFIDADSVLRALAVLVNRELPPMGREAAGKPEGRKKLTVKADEKTQKYITQYEQDRMKTNDHDHQEAVARSTVEAIVQRMSDPVSVEAAQNEPSYKIPAHLKDLPPEEIPEEHRGAVLSEIDKFRQSSAARDEEKRKRDRMREMERIRSESNNERGVTSSRGQDSHDKQSYVRPVGFAASEQAQQERSLPADERDARIEERRRQREQDDELRASQDAERRYLASERSRLEHWEREASKERAEEDRRLQKAQSARRTYDQWDQAREAERDLFYIDRTRWRAVRKPIREQESEDDDADRKAQVMEEERARVETERFLAQQAEEMAAFEREQRAAGVLMPNDGMSAPLKLKRVVGAAPMEETGVQPAATVGVLGNADDEGDIGGLRKGRLTHIDLSDEETKKEQFRASLPTDTEALFHITPAWDKIDICVNEERYRKLLDDGIVKSLGEPVPDMVDELLVKLRGHGLASELIDVVEPVLEEEATPLIQSLWLELLIDSRGTGDG